MTELDKFAILKALIEVLPNAIINCLTTRTLRLNVGMRLLKGTTTSGKSSSEAVNQMHWKYRQALRKHGPWLKIFTLYLRDPNDELSQSSIFLFCLIQDRRNWKRNVDWLNRLWLMNVEWGWSWRKTRCVSLLRGWSAALKREEKLVAELLRHSEQR